MKRVAFLWIILIAILPTLSAQNNGSVADNDQAYIKAINDRATKIVSTLSIADSIKAARVSAIIANQYRALNDIQTKRDAAITSSKAELSTDKAALTAKIKTYQDAADAEIASKHSFYIKSLSKELSVSQIDKVKDGMTYNVVPITYKGYLAMIPSLTPAQKEQIMNWLLEAREHAMDAESSKAKHAWFGKYKGRINNYLSASGYDLKKEGEEWEKRRKAAEATTKR